MAVRDQKKPEVKKRALSPKLPKSVAAKGSGNKPNQGGVVGLRKRLQLSQAVFARLLPVSIRSLATLESGTLPTESVARRLHELQRLTGALAEVMREESIGKWLQTANSAFDGLKPVEIIDRGESDRIWSMIYFLRSGVPS
jgi:DNA-binding transcriptional regulator YiaG